MYKHDYVDIESSQPIKTKIEDKHFFRVFENFVTKCEIELQNSELLDEAKIFNEGHSQYTEVPDF